MARVQAALAPNANPQGLMWLRPGAGSAPPLTPLLPVTVEGGAATSGFLAPDSLTWSLSALRIGMSNNLAMAPSSDGAGLSFTGEQAVFFRQPGINLYAPVTTATLALTGAAAGQLSFDVTLFRSDLIEALFCGLQFLDGTAAEHNPQTPAWYPLFAPDKPLPIDGVPFSVTLDYADPANAAAPARTAFWFQSEAVLQSCYRTDTGQRLDLLPLAADDGVAGALPSCLELREGLHDNQSRGSTSQTSSMAARPVPRRRPSGTR